MKDRHHYTQARLFFLDHRIKLRKNITTATRVLSWDTPKPSAMHAQRKPHGWRSGQGCILSDRNHLQAARATGGAQLIHKKTPQVTDAAVGCALPSSHHDALNIATKTRATRLALGPRVYTGRPQPSTRCSCHW